MPDLPIVTAFNETIRGLVVRIIVHCHGSDELRIGTGCIFGRVDNPDHGAMGFVLTAAHVLRLPQGESASCRIERTVASGSASTARIASFDFRSGQKDGPRAFWHKEHPPVDLGALIVPAMCIDGRPFLDADERGLRGVGVPMGTTSSLLDEGTRVAWAGFPSGAQSYFGEPVLCYYEGVVAHTRNDAKVPWYLLDGHNDTGVSGGPVWWWNERAARAELVGVIANYTFSGTGEPAIPGFTGASALNPFRQMIEKVWLKAK